MRQAALLLAVVAVAHYSYHLVFYQARFFYIMRGVEGVALAILLIPDFMGWPRRVVTRNAKLVGFIGITWLIAEESQCAVCQALTYNEPATVHSRLCVETYGITPYEVVFCLIMSGMVIREWRKFRQNNGR